MWGNLGNLGALGKWVLQSSCTQGYAQHNGLEPPRGRGWQLIARTNTAVFLLRKNCIRVAGGSCRKKLGKAADRRVIWNPVPPDPVNNSGNTETGGNKKWGAVKKSQQMKIWERTDSWVTLVAWQQYWLSWPVSAKKPRKKTHKHSMRWTSEMDWKAKSCTSATSCVGRTSENWEPPCPFFGPLILLFPSSGLL